MKKMIFFFAFFIFSLKLLAQSESGPTPLSIGYFGHTGWHPGVKIGTQLQWKEWASQTGKTDILKSFYVSPQVAYYTYPKVHTGFLVNTDFGYKRVKSHKNKYSAFSIGIGFLNQSQVSERKIKLSDAAVEKTKENLGWLLTTLNYEIGKSINEQIGWYSKLSYGHTWSSKRENSTVLIVEMGLNLFLF